MAEPSAAEQRWLQTARDFVLRALPASPGPGGTERPPLDAVLRCVRSAGGGDLPLGYSFISISDLKHQQRAPCCSHLTFSTNKFKEWAHQGQGALPMHSSLPRAYLILFGYLTDGRQEDKDGCLYVKDNTGIIACELLHFELEWLESLFLFPSWAYIPQTDHSAAGYIEILADPVPVNRLPKEVSETIPVIYPALAEPLLVSRIPCKKRSKLSVAGELSRLSPLLCIHQKTFFFLFLKCFTSVVWVPVLVKKPNQLAWHHTLQLGHRYTITGLSISSLKKSGQRMFVTSISSRLLPYCAEKVKEQALDSSWQGESSLSASLETTEHFSDSSELSAEEWPGLMKESKIISYVGTVTKILNAQAGLYELDNKVCLCLAYQQLLNSARGIRPGACVELIDVHLLQKPLVSSPFIVLGACLNSTVLLRSFSRLSTPYHPPVTSRNLYLQLLFRYNLGMPLYLWLVSLLETFKERFSCFFGHQRLLLSSIHQNPGPAEKFLVPVLQAVVPDRRETRDIYQEILAKIHHCPLQKYLTLDPPYQVPSLSALGRVAEQKGWEGFCPSQLLSPLEAQHMGTQELNRRLAWSYCTLSAGSFQPRLILLGVLRVSSRRSSLQLQDSSGTLPCVISHRDSSPFANTALIGSLLQVENYQLVVERFIQSDFPSWEQLENSEHVREKKTSIYVQFYFEDVQVLHSVEGQIQKDCRSNSRKKNDGSSTSDLETPEAKVLKLEDPTPDPGGDEGCQRGQSSTGRTSCVSHLFLVTQKEGLMLRNYQLLREGGGEEQEPQRSFQATVLWLGRPQLWSHPRETKSLPELEEASHDGGEGMTRQEALLLFMGKSLQWFPFLHLDGLYRFIVPHCSDLEVFDKLSFPPVPAEFLGRPSCPLCLPVQDNWHLQHETWLPFPAECQLAARAALTGMDQRVSSIPEILSNSFRGSLVSFCGEIVERTLCASPKNEKPSATLSLRKQKGSLLASDHSVKLSISAAAGSPVVLDIYIAATYLQHLRGLLPGAKILFQNLERKISRFHNVYCAYIASSCVTILSLPASHQLFTSSCAGRASSPSLVFISNLQHHLQTLPQARILCHVSCVLTLSLQWVCSLCSSIFKEGKCTRHSPPCPSHTGVRQASARVLVEDGTGEALVLCRNQHVAAMLGLSLLEWEAVQSCVQSRGSLFIQYGETTGTGCVEELEDPIACYLRNLCRSSLICRPILLDFSLDRKPSKVLQPAPVQVRNFRCGEMEFVSQVRPRQSLLCLNVEEVGQKALCCLNRERIERMSGHCQVGTTT
ncbi:CST complex subunit CTC1 isoform X1 [Lagopus muta]|uniref:CST complex subunit CTC1 isoform X1 n=1 Tax=Lagopus muta TaxID=64668 RepID=UPI0020A22BB3|nr:CST complex subunit CTC1 isoform X1 [Lagopus muta]